MKLCKLLTTFCLILFFIYSNTLKAQNRVKAFISTGGELSFKVEKTTFFICITPKGDITGYSILPNGPISYDIHGRIEKIGKVKVSYDFHERVEMIDNESISFDHHGKVDQIGDTRISYDMHNRLELVGEQKISYDINGRVDKVGLAEITYNNLGKVENVNHNQGFLYLNLAEN